MLMWLILLWRDSSPRAAAAMEYAISLLEWYGHDEDHRVYSGAGPTAAPNSLCLDDDDGDDVYDQSYGLDEYEWENERGRDS